MNILNLTEINGADCVDKETFMRACKAASILGTLQAGYTDFKYVSDATKYITEREALIGVGITGWMNSPDVLFDEENMKAGAAEVKKWNKIVADLIGIRQAARTTTVKPSGNSSVILGSASGIHGEHAKRYFRHVQMTTTDEVAQHIQRTNKTMVEKSVWSSNGTDVVVAFPVETKDGSITKHDLLGVKQLEYVAKAQRFWVNEGTNVELCVDPRITHNVSNTITVDNWDEVEQYIFDNRKNFAGISLLSSFGDRAYPQAPFTEVFTAEEIMEMYGKGSMLASGLIVDALHAFNRNLWMACDTVLGFGEQLDADKSEDVLKVDWVRRAKKFAKNYFNDDLTKMTFCLKDCYNLHKWCSIENTLKPVKFAEELEKQRYTDVDSMAAQACAGGACEVSF